MTNKYYICTATGFVWTYSMTTKWVIISFVEFEILYKTTRPSSKDYKVNPYLSLLIANTVGATAAMCYMLLGSWMWDPLAGCALGNTDWSQ
jgi:hypothetical protein